LNELEFSGNKREMPEKNSVADEEPLRPVKRRFNYKPFYYSASVRCCINRFE